MVNCPPPQKSEGKGRMSGWGWRVVYRVVVKTKSGRRGRPASASAVGTCPGASSLHLNVCGCTTISKGLPVQRERKPSSVLILRPDFS